MASMVKALSGLAGALPKGSISKRNSLHNLTGTTPGTSSKKSDSKTGSRASSKKSTSTRPDIVETNFSDATERSKARNAKK